MGASEVEETGLSGTVEELRVLATHVEQASQLFKLDHVRAAVIVDGLAELHVRWPAVPIVFCETRGLAEERTYRYLAAAQAGAITEHPALQHVSPGNPVEWGTRRAGTRHRRGPRLRPRHRPGRARSRPSPTRNPASLARRTPHHLKPKPSNTHIQTTFARYSFFASKSPRPQLKIKLQT
jgi:hypothetical protein